MIRNSLVALVFSATAAVAQSPFPLTLGGSYTLINQFDQVRTEKDPAGHAQLLFFGYVNCPDICTADLSLMADVANGLDAQGHKITPVMITIAPDQGTVETLGEPLAKWHPDFIGLTGDSDALKDAYKAFWSR